MFERATSNQIERNTSTDAPRPALGHAPTSPVWTSLALRPAPLQRKLAINPPDDAYEREADRVAEAVTNTTGPQVQRACDCGGTCDECSEGAKVQTMHAGGDHAHEATAPPVVDEVLRSPGQPLEPATRSFMEDRFAHDFSNVRVHSDPKAAESAKSVNALAYTVGSDVVLGEGQHAQHTDSGRKLLAHELTHVVQQSGGLGRKTLQRWTINKCNQAQSVYVEDAFAKSFDTLSKAARQLEQKPTTDNVKAALWLAFRSDSDATAQLVSNRISTLRDKITSASVTCTDDTKYDECKTDTGFHSRGPADYGMIYLCMPAFSNATAIEQSNTLTHEAAHKYLGVRDKGYFAKDCVETARVASKEGNEKTEKDSGTAGDNPSTRLNNADSYSCFVHFLLRRGKDALTKQAADYRGENLTFEVPEKWIATQTTQPKRTIFRITDLPTNSGFRAKWSLTGNGEQFRLMSPRNDQINPLVYDSDALEVYVPSDTRSQLEQKNVREVILQVDVQLYRPEQGQPDPPIITKTEKLTVSHGKDTFDVGTNEPTNP
jgi:uncharacterized protein DUF4157